MNELALALILICSDDKINRADCEAYITECVEQVAARPEIKKVGLSKAQIGFWLADQKVRVNVCR